MEDGGERTATTLLWWLCLFVAPAVLVGIELFHPAHFTHDPGMFRYLSEAHGYDPAKRALAYFGPEWWFLLHMIQTPMVGLVCVGLWLMVRPVGDGDGPAAATLAWLGRIAILVTFIYFTALDSIGGFGLARSIIVAHELAALPPDAPNHLSADQLAGVALLLDAIWDDPWVGGVGSFVSETASWAVLVAAACIAGALLLAGKAPVLPLVLILAFGWFLHLSHTAMNGPVAFAALLVAAAWIRLRPDRRWA